MKKRYLFISIITFILISICTVSKGAGNVTLSASSSKVNVGDTVAVTINLSGASVATLTTRMTVDTSKFQYISGPSNSSFSNGRAIYTWTDPTGGASPITGGTIATFRFKAIAEGTASFSISGDFYDSDEKPINPSFLGTSVTVVTPAPTPNPTPEPEPTPTPNPSTPPNQDTSSGNTNNGASNNTGNTGGSNTNSASSNANLKSLHLSEEGLSPAFKKNTTNYNLIVLSTVNDINIQAQPEDSSAKVSITGNTGLKIGNNTVRIVVTAADKKTTKTYTIQVTKTQDVQAANASLENLAIENVVLTPEFNPDITEYTTQVDSTVENLHLLAVPQIEGANVSITGHENLQFGNNTVNITVNAKDGITTKTYTIQIYRKTQEEEERERIEEQLRIEEEERLKKEQEEQQKKEQQENEKGNGTVGHIIMGAVILVGIAGIIYMLIQKYKKDIKKEN